MKQITFERVLAMSGIDSFDSEFEQDIKFLQWMGNRKYQIIVPPPMSHYPTALVQKLKF